MGERSFFEEEGEERKRKRGRAEDHQKKERSVSEKLIGESR